MVDEIYQKALSLFQKGEYEEAWVVAQDSVLITSDDGQRLVNECEKLITEQYIYLIKEYIEQEDYSSALRKKREYISKYGINNLVSDIVVPKKLKTPRSPENNINSQTQSNSNKNSSSGKQSPFNKIIKSPLFVIATILVIIILTVVITSIFNPKKNNYYSEIARQDSIRIADSIAAVEQETAEAAAAEEEHRTDEYVSDENTIADMPFPDKLKKILSTLKDEYGQDHVFILCKDLGDYPCVFIQVNQDYDNHLCIFTNKNVKIIHLNEALETSDGGTAIICIINKIFKSNNPNKYFIIGNNNSNSIYNGDVLVEIDVSDFTTKIIASGREINHEGNKIIVTKAILTKEGSCNAENEYRYTNSYYNLYGKPISDKSSSTPNNVCYKGDMAGFPITMNISIDQYHNISGQYKNVRYGTTLKLSGHKDSDGTLNITASNNSETLYFTLSHSSSGSLDGYGSNGSKNLKVHLEK